jgi:hypothetical protein
VGDVLFGLLGLLLHSQVLLLALRLQVLLAVFPVGLVLGAEVLGTQHLFLPVLLQLQLSGIDLDGVMGTTERCACSASRTCWSRWRRVRVCSALLWLRSSWVCSTRMRLCAACRESSVSLRSCMALKLESERLFCATGSFSNELVFMAVLLI